MSKVILLAIIHLGLIMCTRVRFGRGFTECQDFDRIRGCPPITRKVCAVDENNFVVDTYRNNCFACIEDCNYGYYDGKCPSREQVNCPRIRPTRCNNDLQPVCGEQDNGDYENYKNKCWACKDRNVDQYSIGKCEYST